MSEKSSNVEKYFEIIQKIIERMAKNSFNLKTWTLTIIAGIIATIWLREKLSKRILIGVAIAMSGNALLLGEGIWSGWGFGEMLVLGATIIWASEYVISKKVMNEEGISPRLLALGRMGYGALILLGFTAVTGQLWMAGTYSALQWQWTLISAAFIFAFVSFWYIGLANTTVINAIAITPSIH